MSDHCGKPLRAYAATAMDRASSVPGQAGFSLMELLVSIGIIVALAGISIPLIGVVRKRAAVATAQQMVEQLTQCLESYRNADAGGRRYPPPQSDQSLSQQPPSVGSSAVLKLLEDARLDAPRTGTSDEMGRLLDPWRRPYRYALVRPVVADPDRLKDWNWDESNARERAWGKRWDAGANAIVAGPLPFAYVYSLGPAGDAASGSGWVYARDAR